MTRIVVLKPPAPVVSDLPQCSAQVDPPSRNPLWRREHYGKRPNDHTRCQRGASVEIDGKPYCRPHAGQVALAILLRETPSDTD